MSRERASSNSSAREHFDRAASDAFQLVVGTLDYSGPHPSVQESELRRLLVTLARDQRAEQLPAEVERLRGVVDTVLTNKARIETKLEQLAVAPVVEETAVLTQAAQGLYQTAVARVDRARLMLSVYAVALLAAVGLIALRLRSSYREINAANEELEELNQSLEQRVAERTNELAGTLSDLKESQVQLVQAEKMSSLGQLVAGISHEINTPLLYLANNAELVRERIGLMREFVTTCAAAFAVKSEEFKDRAEYQARFVHALKDVKTMLREQDLSRQSGGSRRPYARQHRRSGRSDGDGAEPQGLQSARPRPDCQFRRERGSREDAVDRQERRQAQG